MDGRSEGTPDLDGARRVRDPLRVLHVSQPTVAGVPHVVASLVRDQVARGWDVSVACPPRGSLPDLVRAEGAAHLRWLATRQPGPLRAAARVWERNGARWADAVVCVSEGERQRGIRAGVEADIRVIPNGIDLASWPPAAPNGREAAR